VTQCSLLDDQSQYISMPTMSFDLNASIANANGDFGDLADLCSGQFQPVASFVT
jgi:hypothetical protein